MSRLDNAGALVASPAPVTSGRVVAKWESTASMSAAASGGQASMWKPSFAVKKGHLYWVVGSVTLRRRESDALELVVWRSKANIEIQKTKVGGGRDTSGSLTSHSVFISAMFTAEADATEELWIVCNVPSGGDSMWLYSYAETGASNLLQHNIYVIDMGPADALVPDRVAGKKIDNAGALVDVPAPPEPVMATWASTDHVSGTAGGQVKIMKLDWTAKPGHQYLVIATFTAILVAASGYFRDYWIYDEDHGVNPARTRLATFGSDSHNAAQERPVALVAVLDGSKSAAVWGNKLSGDQDWQTINSDHRMIVLDLGPK